MDGKRHLRALRASRASRARRASLVAAATGVITVVATLTPASALASTRFGQAVEVMPPANANPSLISILIGVSCASAGTCVGGGSYTTVSGASLPMVAADSHGHWARAQALALPANAQADPFAQVSGVACPAEGACVAAGYYQTSSRDQAFVATESSGHWGTGQVLPPPSNTATPSKVALQGIACTAPGSCTVIGSYKDDTGLFDVMAVTESHGTWQPAKELSLPADASRFNADPFFIPVACSQAGSCVTAGTYTDSSDVTEAAFITESGGTWHQGTALRLPASASPNPDPKISSVSCTGVGACQAVGSFTEGLGADVPIVVTDSHGHWARARTLLKVPSNAALPQQSFLTSLSCTRAGSCVAVGGYFDKADKVAPMTLVESRGKWTTATQVRLPSNAHAGTKFSAGLDVVACKATGCTAIGSYVTKSGVIRPMATATP